MTETEEAKTTPLDLVGPRMRSFLGALDLGGQVIKATEECRQERVAGRAAKQEKGPLEDVMAQVGLDIPNLEALLAKIMGGSPEARTKAAEIIQSRDMAALFQHFVAHASEAEGAEAEPPSTEPQGAEPQARAHRNAPQASGPVFSPPPSPPPHRAPSPPHFGARQSSAQFLPGWQDIDYSALTQTAAWLADLPVECDYQPNFDRQRRGPPPGWRRPVAKKPPPPPTIGTSERGRSRPGWTTSDTLPTRPRPTPTTAAPPAANKPALEGSEATASRVAQREVRAAEAMRDELKSFMVWMTGKIEAIEGRIDAGFADLARRLDEMSARIARLELAIEVLKINKAAAEKAKTEAAVTEAVLDETAEVVVVEAEVAEVAEVVEIKVTEVVKATEVVEATEAEVTAVAEIFEVEVLVVAAVVEVTEVAAVAAVEVATVVEDDDEAEIAEVELHAEVAEVDEINESDGTKTTDVVEMTEVDAEAAEVADEALAEPSLTSMTEFCGGFFDKFEHIEREIEAKAAQIEGALTDRLCAAEAELARLATT